MRLRRKRLELALRLVTQLFLICFILEHKLMRNKVALRSSFTGVATRANMSRNHTHELFLIDEDLCTGHAIAGRTMTTLALLLTYAFLSLISLVSLAMW